MRSITKLLSYIVICSMAACGEAFLDIKPSQNQREPGTVADYLALLDNPTANNNPMNVRSSHTLGIIGADEFFISAEHWNTFSNGIRFDYQKNAYTWEETVYMGGEGGIQNPTDFETGYQRILTCNVVLDGLNKLDVQQQETDWQLAYGMALFHRALNYYNLAQLYCPVYSGESVSTNLGMPLRLEADPTIVLDRSSLVQTYGQIISDLESAAQLLPDRPSVPFRPSSASVYALMARIYLQMADYEKAGKSADRCLAMQDGLIDFNELEIGGNYAFPLYGIGNPEVIFTTSAYNASIYGSARFNADTVLLEGYGNGDLRKKAYFRFDDNGQSQYFGSYYGNNLFFTGLATDEVYLIRAECNARIGNVSGALNDLNHLRKHRIGNEAFSAMESGSAEEVLDWVIAERRLELVLRGIRWGDLRRLNREARYRTSLVRQLGEQRFELQPDDPRWTWPLPPEAIRSGGYMQNER